jgi:transposase
LVIAANPAIASVGDYIFQMQCGNAMKDLKQRTIRGLARLCARGQISVFACSGWHFLGRALREQSHDVKLIPAQFVKPFVKVEQERLHRR